MRIIIHDLNTAEIYEPKSLDDIKPEHIECWKCAVEKEFTIITGRVICEVKK